jgi:uncharacterized membrane protein YeaQ/YmgE (transglycosylase-associated protein family)
MNLRSHLSSPATRQARRSQPAPPPPLPPAIEPRRSEYPDGDPGPPLWKLLLASPRVNWRLVGFTLTIVSLVACGVALGWLVLDIARSERTGSGRIAVATIGLVGAVVGWIAADVERAYRTSLRYRF